MMGYDAPPQVVPSRVMPIPTLRRLLLLLLFGAMSGRALVPAGYMPGIGSGSLFELCHDAVPAEFLAWLDSAGLEGGEHAAHAHHHHGSEDRDDHAGEHDPCTLGHMLSVAWIDDTGWQGEVVRAVPVVQLPVADVKWHAPPRLLPETRAPPLAFRAS